ncbi:spore coat-associated protein N precursor [Oceanobacillus picturae]|jgi:spore coat-associated protein N|uniref:Spore coat-associated protein N n=2 Tax=Oceanobacillus TaxID=182709 RepID=W9ACV3_9BACI|nr:MULTISPECIES: CalY family protein [Oceanobacillus]AVQ99935.1 cell division protein FtsN [Oceanobacillus iheyensis]NAO99796.1 cell division protein FtsN [Halomonas sp. MG34]MCG3420291.1 M73 family metallopeptidase [Oceanobacillus jordanicus]CDO03328.1 Spore coat-associated protein N precursor [Oceanobacillus picturae]GAQ16208.1 spore coat-associated protein N precursor [Oceanobacillus picturae]
MNIKKQLGLGIASAALGLTLVSGGTFAYFSDTETSSNTFAAGTLDLAAAPTEIIEVDNIKPGDTMVRDFELQNNGTLDIEKVLLDTDYTVTDAAGDNTGDFGEHIMVEFLYNADKLDEVIYQTTLAELKTMTPEAVNENVFLPLLGENGLPVGTIDDLVVQFNFVDNGEDQNEFQGDTLSLEWTFTAQQTAGEDK